MSKKVLVTGCAGFIGFHAALALVKRGDQVVGLDNFNSYYSQNLKRARAKILEEQGIELVESDLSDKEKLLSLFEMHQFSDCLHLGAQAGVRFALTNPECYLKSNIDGFLSILEACRHYPTPLTYASSSSVYGLNEKIPFAIEDRTDSPANLYAATKKSNELMAYAYSHLFGIKTKGLRFFTVYGPWGRPDMAYFLFADAIYNKKPITLFNDGNMQRDFTYIDDAVDGALRALDYKESALFNIGNNSPEPLLKLVTLLEKELGIEATKIFSGKSLGEVTTTFADIDHSKAILGYKPKTSLEEGIKKFVAWYLETPRATFQ